jgi:hypothetical protein
MGRKTIVILLVGLAFASGCVASGASRYRPCNELRTDMSVSLDELAIVALIAASLAKEYGKLKEPWVLKTKTKPSRTQRSGMNPASAVRP